MITQVTIESYGRMITVTRDPAGSDVHKHDTVEIQIVRPDKAGIERVSMMPPKIGRRWTGGRFSPDQWWDAADRVARAVTPDKIAQKHLADEIHDALELVG